MRHALLALLPLPLLAACGERFVLEVDHYRTPCTTEFRYLCLVVRQEGEADFGAEYLRVGGFEPELGHVYELEIRERRILNPAMDQPGLEWDLVEVLSDETVPPDTRFTIRVDGTYGDRGYNPDLAVDGDAGMLLGELPFGCADAQVCEDAAAVEADDLVADVTFGYDAGYDLVLHEVSEVAP